MMFLLKEAPPHRRLSRWDSYLWNWTPRICTCIQWLLPNMHTAHLMSTPPWASQSRHSVLHLPSQHAHPLPHPSLSFLSPFEGAAMIITPCRTSDFSCSGSSFQSWNVYFFQKSHPFTGNLNSETPGDSKNMFLHCEDVLVQQEVSIVGDQGQCAWQSALPCMSSIS